MQQAMIASISEALDRQMTGDGGFLTPVPGLGVMRWSTGAMPHHMHYRPKLCFVAQGKKEVYVGDRMFAYGPMQSLIVTVEVPVLSQVIADSPDKPFIGATLELDIEILTEVMAQLGTDAFTASRPEFSMMVEDLDEEIAAAIVRLLGLLGRPQSIGILYPAIMREICYWLLTGPAGAAVARSFLPTGQTFQIARAIALLRQRYDTPISVGELARAAGMSASSFHQHFKAATSMSPLQYQKHLRLLEARRRMLADGEKAGVAAFAVGYESVSQFNREYSRMFGAPPRRETQAARASQLAPEISVS